MGWPVHAAVHTIADPLHAMSDSSEEETPQPLQQREPAATMAPASPARSSGSGGSSGGLVLGLAAAGLAIAGGVALFLTGKKEAGKPAPKPAGTPKKVVPKRTPSQAAQADRAAEASGSAAAAAAVPQPRQAALHAHCCHAVLIVGSRLGQRAACSWTATLSRPRARVGACCCAMPPPAPPCTMQ